MSPANNQASGNRGAVVALVCAALVVAACVVWVVKEPGGAESIRKAELGDGGESENTLDRDLRNVDRDEHPLPQLIYAEIDGVRTPQIDSDKLERFQIAIGLPEIPDFARLSCQTADDIYKALRAVSTRPSNANAIGDLGRVFQSHQYPAKALTCYLLAKTLDPNAFEWSYYSGRIHADAFEFDKAIKSYELAADLNSDYAPTFLALGNLYLQSGDAAKARQSFDAFVALRPNSSHGYLGLGQVAVSEQQHEKALEHLRAAIAQNPKDFRAHNLLGQTYQRLGQADKATYHLGIVKGLDRRSELTKRVLFDDPLYHKMLAANTTDAALAERMRAAKGTGQPLVAIRIGKELCRRDPMDAKRMHSLAGAYKQAKQFANALASANKAVSLDAEFLEASITKSQLLLILRRSREALELLDQIVAKAPDSFDGHYNRGTAQVLNGQNEAAVESFRNAVRLRDESARAHVALAEALGASDRHAEAMKEYRRALELDPSNARARSQLKRAQSPAR